MGKSKSLQEELREVMDLKSFAENLKELIQTSSGSNKLKAIELFAKYAYGTPTKQDDDNSADGANFDIKDMFPNFVDTDQKEVKIVMPKEDEE